MRKFGHIKQIVCNPSHDLNFKMRDVFRRQRNQIGELNARIEDSLLGQKVVKAFTNEQMETNKFETADADADTRPGACPFRFSRP